MPTTMEKIKEVYADLALVVSILFKGAVVGFMVLVFGNALAWAVQHIGPTNPSMVTLIQNLTDIMALLFAVIVAVKDTIKYVKD